MAVSNMVIMLSLLLPQRRSLIYMIYGVCAVFVTMGWSYVTLVVSHCVLLYTVSLVKRKWLCFVAGLTSLATFKMEPLVTWQVGHMRTDTGLAVSYGV